MTNGKPEVGGVWLAPAGGESDKYLILDIRDGGDGDTTFDLLWLNDKFVYRGHTVNLNSHHMSDVKFLPPSDEHAPLLMQALLTPEIFENGGDA